MNEEKILFKCALSNITTKELNNVVSRIRKNFSSFLKKAWVSIIILMVIFYIWDLVYNWDFFLIEAIGIILSDKLFILPVILLTLLIWYQQHIIIWLKLRIFHIQIKNIKNPYPYIYFYQSFYETSFLNPKTKSYDKVRMNYSDISDFYAYENMYIIHIPKPKSLGNLIFIQKDSFIIGTEQEFIKFINSKIASNHIESK